MSCFHPLSAWRFVGLYNRGTTGNDKDKIYFGDPPFDLVLPQYTRIETFKLPCGVCVGCRIDRSKSWALRMVLEAKEHEHNCFLTLTYDDDHLPKNGSLDFDELQRFFKRLRKKIGYEKIRYYAVGEYGAKLQRPHYHIILFGYDFPDRRLWSCSGAGYLYRSPTLESVWNSGYSTIGDVTFESCAYCARYVQKKLYGADRLALTAHYGDRLPEAARMSRRPGIANSFFHRYHDDFYPKDYIVVKGIRYKPSKYFDTLYKKEHPEEFLKVKVKRLEHVLEHLEENTPDRLAVRESVLLEKTRKLVRGFEQQ